VTIRPICRKIQVNAEAYGRSFETIPPSVNNARPLGVSNGIIQRLMNESEWNVHSRKPVDITSGPLGDFVAKYATDLESISPFTTQFESGRLVEAKDYRQSL
jgi:hypothetical protein